MPSGIRTQVNCGRRCPCGRHDADPHRGEAGLEGVGVELVPREAGFQTLLDDQRKRLAEGVIHADGGGVVIEAVAPPVALNHPHVEIPALHLRFPRLR